MIIVGMADLKVIRHPGGLTTLGLGSCVGIALYDAATKTAGLAHVMLPDSTKIKNNSNVAKFADTAAVRLLEDMLKLGAKKQYIRAKIAGGAQMFAFDTMNENLRIGDRNVEATLKVLQQLAIPVVARDTGKNFGRTVELFTEDGRLVIKTIGYGSKTI